MFKYLDHIIIIKLFILRYLIAEHVLKVLCHKINITSVTFSKLAQTWPAGKSGQLKLKVTSTVELKKTKRMAAKAGRHNSSNRTGSKSAYELSYP